MYSEELRGLIDALLAKDPNNRPSIQELVDLPLIRKNILSIVHELDKKQFFILRKSLIRLNSSFKTEF